MREYIYMNVARIRSYVEMSMQKPTQPHIRTWSIKEFRFLNQTINWAIKNKNAVDFITYPQSSLMQACNQNLHFGVLHMLNVFSILGVGYTN